MADRIADMQCAVRTTGSISITLNVLTTRLDSLSALAGLPSLFSLPPPPLSQHDEVLLLPNRGLPGDARTLACRIVGAAPTEAPVYSSTSTVSRLTTPVAASSVAHGFGVLLRKLCRIPAASKCPTRVSPRAATQTVAANAADAEVADWIHAGCVRLTTPEWAHA